MSARRPPPHVGIAARAADGLVVSRGMGSLPAGGVWADDRAREIATPRLTYRPELDGLRALAVLAVMAYHFGVPFAQAGFLGVDVFFVLSGFLITSILAGEWQRSGTVDLRRFYVRRGLRLLPAFWLMLVVLSPVTPTQDLAAASVYGINWTMALHQRPDNALLGHTWSLAVEWQYYLVWPLVLILMLRKLTPRNVAIMSLALGFASAAWRATVWQFDPDWIRVFAGTDTHADGLLIGSALGLAAAFSMVPLSDRLGRALSAGTAAVIAAVVALVILPPLPWGFFAVVGDLLVVITTAVVITRMTIYPPGVIGRVVGFSPLVQVGVISYGLYLWHVPVVNELYGGGLVAVVLATFLAAGLSYRYFEAPLLRVKARVGS